MQVVEFVAQCEFGRGDYGETVVSVGLTDEEATRLRRMATGLFWEMRFESCVDVKDIYDKVYAKAVDQITGELLEYDERVKEAVEEGDKVDAVYGITIDWPEEYKPEEDE